MAQFHIEMNSNDLFIQPVFIFFLNNSRNFIRLDKYFSLNDVQHFFYFD